MFDTDKLRQAIAARGDLDALMVTYLDPKLFPDLPNMNSPKMWNFHSQNSTTSQHPVTLKRIHETAKLVDVGGKILDLGVGYGDIVEELRKKNPKVDFFGIDISVDSIKRLKEKYPMARFGLNSLDSFTPEAFNTVLALEVLEHIPAPEIFKMLRGLSRILVPGGDLVVSVPCGENLEWITSPCPDCGALKNTNGHVRSYSPELVEAELKLAGFDIVERVNTLLPQNYILKARKP